MSSMSLEENPGMNSSSWLLIRKMGDGLNHNLTVVSLIAEKDGLCVLPAGSEGGAGGVNSTACR